MYLQYYLEQLGYNSLPEFLIKYLQTPSLLRLKKVGYFCGMDYASKSIYDFREYISRYDHSLTVSLLTYKLTEDKKATLAALFHDIATPCFSHVIDYMNKDYEKQESTEEYTEKILRNDEYLNECLKQDGISIDEIIDFKKYTIVDNDRPKLCADRIDGVILTAIGWTKNIELDEIKDIVGDLTVVKNEFGENEIAFKSSKFAKKAINISNSIDEYCHSKEDNYMMELLASITKYAIDKNYISYDELYKNTEEDTFNILNNLQDTKLQGLMNEFRNAKKDSIPNMNMPNIKVRDLKPIVDNKRM